MIPYRKEVIKYREIGIPGINRSYDGWKFGGYCAHCKKETLHTAEILYGAGEGGLQPRYQMDPYTGAIRNRCLLCNHISFDVVTAQRDEDEYFFYRVYPTAISVNLPDVNEDAPQVCRETYAEASSVFPISYKAAAALMRLALQQLFNELEVRGKTIAVQIEELGKQGLPEDAIRFLEYVRVVGNNAVHPGQIDFDEDADIARHLFAAFNYAVDTLISRKKKSETIIALLPQKEQKKIENHIAKCSSPDE